MNHKKYQRPVSKMIIFEEEDKTTILQDLKYGESFNEIIAELIHQKAESIRMEKNLMTLDKSAISNLDYQYTNNQSRDLLTLNQDNARQESDNKQTSLDLYLLSRKDINQYLHQVQDLEQLRDLRDKGKLTFKVCQTKINRLIFTSNNNNKS